MQKIIDIISELLRNQEYGKFFKIIVGMFVFIAPSTSYIFIYKREMLFSLDVFKFLVICVTINLVFIIGIFVFSLLCNIFKKDIYDKANIDRFESKLSDIKIRKENLKFSKQNGDINADEIEKLLLELDKELKKLQITTTINLYESVIFDVLSIISCFTILIWLSYFISKVYNFSVNSHKANFFILLSLISGYVLNHASESIKILKDAKVKKLTIILVSIHKFIFIIILIIFMMGTLFICNRL